MTIACPHCSGANPDECRFCEACGLALPSRERLRPRVIERKGFAGSGIGRDLQLEQLDKQARSARNVMLAIGILQVLLAGILAAVAAGGAGNTPAEQQTFVIMAISVGVVGVIFIGLGLWARRSPLAASVVGLVLYLSIIAADAVANPATLASGIVIKVIFILALAKAVSAGVKHRSLRLQMKESTPVAA